MKKQFRITFLSILLICGAVSTVSADYFWSENCQRAYAEAIQLDFESAKRCVCCSWISDEKIFIIVFAILAAN